MNTSTTAPESNETAAELTQVSFSQLDQNFIRLASRILQESEDMIAESLESYRSAASEKLLCLSATAMLAG